jgi:hypothetical protein
LKLFVSVTLKKNLDRLLVRKAHPRVGGTDVSILPPQWSTDGKAASAFVAEK